LDGHPALNQTWVNRYSIALAFIVKTALVLSMETAYSQQMWKSLRDNRRGTAIETIDALVDAPTSLFSFLVLDLWRSSFTASLIVALAWLVSLTAIVSPSTLNVVLSVSSSVSAMEVPTVTFADVRHRGLDGAGYIQGAANEKFLVLTMYSSDLDYIPSPTATRISTLVGYSGQWLSWSSPCGQNCSYDSSFEGLALRCDTVDEISPPGAPWEVGIWGLDDLDGTNFKADVFLSNHTIFAVGIASETRNF